MAIAEQVVESATFAAKVAGFGAFGLAIEELTGYPSFFWISAFIGAFVIRRPFDGTTIRVGGSILIAALAWSWMWTNATLDFLGLSSDVYLAPVAGFWAGFGEFIGKMIRDPDKLGAYVRLFLGRGKSNEK